MVCLTLVDMELAEEDDDRDTAADAVSYLQLGQPLFTKKSFFKKTRKGQVRANFSLWMPTALGIHLSAFPTRSSRSCARNISGQIWVVGTYEGPLLTLPAFVI